MVKRAGAPDVARHCSSGHNPPGQFSVPHRRCREYTYALAAWMQLRGISQVRVLRVRGPTRVQL